MFASGRCVWNGEQLHLGDEADETVRRSAAGHSLLADVRPGDWVALHFDWICDRLNADEVVDLERANDQQLQLVNLELRAAAGVRSASP